MTPISTKVRRVRLLQLDVLSSYWRYTFVSFADGTFNPFGTYKFTGSLRPVYPLSPKREVPAHIPRPDYAEDGTMKRILYAIPRAL